MVLRALFALAFVCLVPFHEPNIGLPMPHRDSINHVLAQMRQSAMAKIQRAAREIRAADHRGVRARFAEAGTREGSLRQ